MPDPLSPAGERVGERGVASPLLLIPLLLALPARAAEVWRDELGARLDLSGFSKSLLSGVLLQPDAVTAAKARARGLGLDPADVPEGGLLDAHLVRAEARFRFSDRIKFVAAYQLQLSLASSPAFAGGSALTGTVGGTAAGAQRRITELAGTLERGDTWRLDHNLDRLALTIALPFGDLTIGRQVLSWGTGRLWNPTDVLSPFPPTVIDREVRRGFDAVRLAVALGEVTQLDLLYLPQLKAEEHGGVVRFQTNWKGWDGSLSVGKYVRDLVFGADVVGDLGPVGVHAEGAYTVELLGLGTSDVRVGEHFFRGVIGGEVKPHEHLVLMAEYAFNGYGTNDPDRLAAVLSSARVIRGEIFGGGMHQAAVAAVLQASDLLSVNVSVLANLADPSALLIPSLEHSFTQSVLVRAGAYVPLGAPPNPKVYDGLSPAELLDGDVVRGRGLRSEYGSASWGAFVQVGLYVP